MNKVAGYALATPGVSLVLFSAIGLYNSGIDSRLALTIALGAAGLILAPVGVRQFSGQPRASA